MSAQAGIWNFDGQPADERWLATMSRVLAQHAPDGETIYRAPGVAMLYRPFHTTAESRAERQPFCSRRGLILTWDGRLDNGVELSRELGGSPSDQQPDIALVAAAFERWGEHAFARLDGDFAVVIWDPHTRSLYLATDFAGPRHLYYVLDRAGVRWSTRLDALVMHGGGPWTLDEEWLGTYLMFRPDAYRTPYAQIRTVGPATFCRITPSQEVVRRYWNWQPARIRYRSDREYEEHFTTLFRQAVKRRLRSDTPILAELSGGVDSSAIVCMADWVAERDRGVPRIDTVSHLRAGDPNGDLGCIGAIEQQRGRIGTHVVDTDGDLDLVPSFDLPFKPHPGFASAARQQDERRAAIMAANGNRVVLSGLAGDEVLGGIPFPLGQVADAMVQGHVAELVSLVHAWSRIKQIPVWHFAGMTLRHLLRTHIGPSGEIDSWLAAEFSHRVRLSAKVVSRAPGALRRALPSQRGFADAFESERQIVALDDTPLVGAAEKRYPYMDRALVSFLFSIPNTQLLRPRDRRSLLRRSLAGLVPDAVISRPLKAGGSSQLVATLQRNRAALDDALAAIRPELGQYFDCSALERTLLRATHGVEDKPMRLLRGVAAVLWVRALAEYGLVRLTRPAEPHPRRREAITSGIAAGEQVGSVCVERR